MSQYEVGYYGGGRDGVLVVDVPMKELMKMSATEQQKHIVVEFKVRGLITTKVANVWAKKIAEQLNQFENANAAVAKMI